MNFPLLARILGLLALFVSSAMLICAGYGQYLDTEIEQIGSLALLKSVGLGGFFGVTLLVCGRHAEMEISRREGIAVVGLGWIIAGLIGALPYVVGMPQLSMVDAWFESVSGFTTTGSTVITNLDAFPRCTLLWRSLTQWLGGLGILVMFVALLSYLGVGSKALFRHESSALSGKDLKARVQDVAMRLWLIYLGLTVVCALGLWALGMTFYESVSHAFTAISTGGFSTENRSIAAFGHLGIELWLVVFMLLGSVSFLLYAWLLRGGWDHWRRDEETRYFILLVMAATVIIALDMILLGHHSVSRALRESLFQVVSIITTTGYATEDYNQWPPFSDIVLLTIMCIGGCTGSTAGGLKVGRWVVFAKMCRQQIVNAFRPNQVMRLQLNGVPLDDGFRTQTVFLICLAGVSIFVGAGIISLLEPALDMDSATSAAIACLFNIGPGIGKVGPIENFAFLGPATKLFLSFLMLVGRLEFFAILVLFCPSLWRKY